MSYRAFVILRAIAAIIMVSLFACNRNSLELPPPENRLVTKEINCFLGNTAIALIRFKQDTVTDREGIVNIEVINLTGEPINDCRIFIEMCNAAPSIKSCQNQANFTLSQLDAIETERRELPFRNIRLSQVFINAGIISTSKKSTPISNVYDGDFVKYLNAPGHLNTNGFVKGVVFADGQSTFRISIGNDTAYNISGRFSDTSVFNDGQFLKFDNTATAFVPVSSLTLEDPANKTGYFKYPDSDTVKFGLKVNIRQPIPAPSLFADSIIFTLTRQKE